MLLSDSICLIIAFFMPSESFDGALSGKSEGGGGGAAGGGGGVDFEKNIANMSGALMLRREEPHSAWKDMELRLGAQVCRCATAYSQDQNLCCFT